MISFESGIQNNKHGNDSSTRFYNLDFGKLVAAICVIIIHTHPLKSFSQVGDSILIQLGCRWAVPFFFLCSGFFFRRKQLLTEMSLITSIQIWRKQTERIFLLWLVWNGVFLCCLKLTGHPFWETLTNWPKLFFPGIYPILWFLPSLCLGELVLALTGNCRKRFFYLILPSAIWIIHTILFMFHSFMMGDDNVSLFSGIFYVAAGAWLADRQCLQEISLRKLFLITMGCFLFRCISIAIKDLSSINISMNLFLLPEVICIFSTLVRLRPSDILQRKLSSLRCRDESVLLYFSHGIIILFLSSIVQSMNSILYFGVVLGSSVLFSVILIRLFSTSALKKILF